MPHPAGRAARRHALAAVLAGLLAAPAWATGSMWCEGPTRTVEIQMRLSEPDLTGLLIGRPDAQDAAPERFAIDQQSLAPRQPGLHATAHGVDRPQHRVALWISGTRGALQEGNRRHRLRCDWSVG